MSTILGGNSVSGTNTYYISLMMQVSAVNLTDYRAFELASEFGNRNFQFGSAADTGSINWGMRVETEGGGTYLTNLSTVTAVPNQTVFAVMKLRYSSAANDDAVSLWVNPSDLGSEAGSTNFVTISGFDFWHNSAMNISLASWSATSGSWDEMRVGTTWADVTPVPEPSTLALLGLTGIAAIGYRIRRNRRS